MKYLVTAICITTAYLVSGKLGLAFDPIGGFASPVWPPTGFALASLLLFGTKFMPAVFLGAFLVNFLSGAPVNVACGIGVGNTLEAFVGAYVLLKWTDFDTGLRRVRDVLWFLVIASLGSTAISASIGVGTLWVCDVLDLASIGRAWWSWWVGDAMGALVVGPVLLTWCERLRIPNWPARRWIEILSVASLTLLLCWLIFRVPFGWTVPVFANTYLVVPPLIWCVLRFNPKITAACVFLLTCIAVAYTSIGRGPFARDILSSGLFDLQLFLGMIVITTLLVAAFTAERTDIIGRLKKEMAHRRKLESSTRYLAAIVQSTDDAVIGKDLNGGILSWNRGAEQMYGYSANEAIGQNIKMLVPPDREHEFEEILGGLRRGQHVDHCETGRRRKDGSIVDVSLQVSPIRNDAGEIIGASGIERDITENRRWQERLSESDMRFRAMADHTPVMIWSSGPDKKCDYFNKMWLDFTGRSLEGELGDGWAEGVHPEDLARCVQIYTTSFDSRRDFRMEYRLLRHDGQYRWILDQATPRYSSGGEFMGYIGSCIDIQDHRDFEKSLQEAIGIRDSFLSIASHELRTPLTGAQLQIQLLQRLLKGRTDHVEGIPKPSELADNVYREMQRFGKLISDMLEVSRITAGRIAMKCEVTDLAEVLRTAIHRNNLQAEGAGCSIKFEIAQTLYGYWDPMRLEQIMANLMSNAIKYGKGKPIEVTMEDQGDRATWAVRDYGIGIDPGDQKKLFQRFERIASERNYGGFGLGLWIVHKLLESMGGEIHIKSAIGQGATFQVTVPKNLGVKKGADLKTRQISSSA